MVVSVRGAMLGGIALLSAGPSAAATPYMFWVPPSFAGAPVQGDEPGIGLPMPGAKPAEVTAGLVWGMRAGLNVAALQCQFSPALATVGNYNSLLSQHAAEFTAAYGAVGAYFKRTGGKTWQTQFDQYTTRTYNGFSTLHAQLGFCDTAASIGREALALPKGSFHLIAEKRMREFRNSLIPSGDGLYGFRVATVGPGVEPPPLSAACYDRKDRLKKQCMVPGQAG